MRRGLLTLAVLAVAAATMLGATAGASRAPASSRHQATLKSDIANLKAIITMEARAFNALKKGKVGKAKDRLNDALGKIGGLRGDLKGPSGSPPDPSSHEGEADSDLRDAAKDDEDALNDLNKPSHGGEQRERHIENAKAKIKLADKKKKAALAEFNAALVSGADYDCDEEVVQSDEDTIVGFGCPDEDVDPDLTFPGIVTSTTGYAVFAGPLGGSIPVAVGSCSGVGTATLHCPVTVPKGDWFGVAVSPQLRSGDKVMITVTGSKGQQTFTVTVP